jgi:hypothetical protein
MKTIRHFIVMLLSISFCMSLTYAQPAQDRQQEAQTTNRTAQDVLIIIQQEQVRFTAQRAVEEMRLQIFDQAGQLVYDSGAVTGQELTWVLRQAGGEAVKSGLYAYTLSVKEPGAADTWVRRGHFIVDRARERDGKTDRLWITSQNESGVGTELTVARNEGETIAGTSALSDQKSARAAETVTGGKESELTAAAAAIAGTTGQIAKFTSATDLGNSVITELNGNIGIGTANPKGKLDVSGNIVLNGNPKTQLSTIGEVTFLDGDIVVVRGRGVEINAGPNGSGILGIGGNPNDNNVFLFGYNSDKTRSASAMWFAGKDGGKLPMLKMSADTTWIEGNLGVDTPFPSAKLDVNGNAAINGDLRVQGVSFQSLITQIQALSTQILSLGRALSNLESRVRSLELQR